MDKSPLEQQKIKITALGEEMRGGLGRLFDSREDFDKKIDLSISQLEAMKRGGLVFDIEEIVKELKASVNINDRELFIAHLLKVLEPIVVLRVTHSKIIDKIEREGTMDDPKNQKLSEVLYINSDNLNAENHKIFFHLTQSKDLMTRDSLEFFKQELERGLIRLAELIKPYPNIEEVWASSWILATRRGRRRIEDLGFTFFGEVGKEEMDEYAPGDERKFAKAFMKREDFLARYDVSR